MIRSIFAVTVCSVSLASCASDRIAPSDNNRPVPLSAVLNQMKCELAQAFTKISQDRLSFSRWLIDGKLTAKIITTKKLDGSIGTPELVPIGSGTSFGFSLNSTVTTSRTSDTVLDFVVSPIAVSTRVCDDIHDPTVKSVGSLGIYDWLAAISETRSGQPVFAPTNLVYVLDFGVKREGGGGLDVVVIPIKATAKANASRDDIQHLQLTFSPGEASVTKAKNAIVTAERPETIRKDNSGDIVIRSNPAPPVIANDTPASRLQENRTLK